MNGVDSHATIYLFIFDLFVFRYFWICLFVFSPYKMEREKQNCVLSSVWFDFRFGKFGYRFVPVLVKFKHVMHLHTQYQNMNFTKSNNFSLFSFECLGELMFHAELSLSSFNVISIEIHQTSAIHTIEMVPIANVNHNWILTKKNTTKLICGRYIQNK